MWNSQLVHIAFYAYKIWLPVYICTICRTEPCRDVLYYTRGTTQMNPHHVDSKLHTLTQSVVGGFFFILEMKWNGTKFGVPSLFRGCGGVALAHQLNVNTQRKKLHAIIAIRAFFPLNCVILFNNIRTAWALGGQSKFAVVHLKVSYFIRSFLNFMWRKRHPI